MKARRAGLLRGGPEPVYNVSVVLAMIHHQRSAGQAFYHGVQNTPLVYFR
jgi:hypothetical protein